MKYRGCFRTVLALALSTAVLNLGCIEFIQLLHGTLPPPSDGEPPDDGGDGDTDGADDEGVPVVRLTVSNPSPQVSETFVEEVILRCEVTDGDTTGVTYQFQDPTARLIVNTMTGRASFIPDAADIGQTFVFTCTATSESGTSDPSNQQVVIPTS